MSDSSKLKYYFYITLLIIAVILIVIIIRMIVDNVLDKEAEDIVDNHLNDINYYERMDGLLYALFGTNELHRSLRQSNQTVSNFSSYMKLNYLCKYFGLVINDETIDDFDSLKDLINELISIDSTNKKIPNKVAKYIPSLTMYYISPKGRSVNQYKLDLFPEDIDEIIELISVANRRQTTPAYQRIKMTKQMRDSVLARDNWTCQRCGNSRYKEPNLLLEVDHIIPVSRGGKTEPNNLQTLCWKCNREKSDNVDFL